MTPFVVSAGAALAAGVLATPAGRLARLAPRPPLAGTRERRAAELLRAFAALAALSLTMGGTDGDLLAAGALAAAALGGRSPATGLTLILVAAVPALRVGSSAVDDVAGAHAVLGPAALSPSTFVAVAAALAAVAGLTAAVVLVPQPPRAGWGTALRLPGAFADALLPLVAILFAVVAAAGPPVAEGRSAGGTAARLAGVVTGVVVAALARRVAGHRAGAGTASLGAGAAVAAAALALWSR